MTESTQPLRGFYMYERVAGGVSPRPISRMEITEEMWETLCQRAKLAGMEPEAYFQEKISEAESLPPSL